VATPTLVEIPDPIGVDELTRTIEARMEDFANHDTIAQHQRSTIEPKHVASDASGRRAVEGLDAPALGQVTAGLHLEHTLGMGGMGIVRLATQIALGRKVAVKTLRPEALNEANTLRLLREAWVTGSLEHPNVVPVYDLGLDDKGAPIIVLRRIEGVEWGELMSDADEVKKRFGADDLLEWNLRILMQVCNAMSLAHARGIVHRDLKPENVMIGEFGEVYVVDWGIAVSMRDDASGRLPLAVNATEMAGTLVYMAPEMLGGHAELINERTDVYLLGAVLFEVLCGHAPHEADNFRKIVCSILLSTVEVESLAAPELGVICRRAMHADSAERFASVAELRTAIEGFLQHRGSSQLEAEASQRLAELRLAIAAVAVDDVERTHVYNLFGASRFGYLQALRSWPANDAARTGLHRAVELMVDYELSHGSPDAAAACLGDLDAPSPELVARVDAALAKERARQGELARLGADMDYSVGRRTRLTLATALSALWIGTPLWAEMRYRSGGQITHDSALIATLILFGAAIILGLWGRESLTKTLINRRLIAGVTMVFVAQLALQLGARLAGIAPETTLTLHFFSWFVVTSMLAVGVDARLSPTAAGYLISFFVVARWPWLRFIMMSVSNGVLLINTVIAWGSLEEAKERINKIKDHVDRRSRQHKSVS
jgi:eukaryotic-like serine/threonine-protein kinase